MTRRLLFEHFPAAAAAIPWLPLAQLPTPLETVTPAGSSPVRVKRDDLTSTAYGGNKVRKLEFLLAAARSSGASRVITAGAFGSHHALATTVHATQLGLAVTLVLFPQRLTPHVREVLMQCAGLGADIRFTRRMEGVPFALWRTRHEFGEGAYVIPPGGSNAIGTLGYVEAGLELAAQWDEEGSRPPKRIHVAGGTLGTAAGLAIGLAITGAAVEIAATRITSRLVTNERALQGLIRGALDLLAPHAAVPLPSATALASRVSFVHDQIGDGYGRATAAGDDAATRFAAAGLPLDATYTAKAAAALLADPLTATGETLFLHTLSSKSPPSVPEISPDALPAPIAALLSEYNDPQSRSGG